MPNRPAARLVLRDGDRVELERLVRSSTVSAGAAQQARIVLLAADGVKKAEIAEWTGASGRRWTGGWVAVNAVGCPG